MEIKLSDIKELNELLGQMAHHVIHAGHLALFCDIDAAEAEMEKAIGLLKPTHS